MAYTYIKRGRYLVLDYELDDRYNTGGTYDDYVEGKFVLLSEDQVAFHEANPAASVKEVWDMEIFVPEPHIPTLEEAINDKKKAINEYDLSENVNGFKLNGVLMWLPKADRVGLMNSISIEKAAGREETTMWFNGFSLTINCDMAIQMLSALELYALACYNVTQAHIHEVGAMTEVDDVLAFDITEGYPEMLDFGGATINEGDFPASGDTENAESGVTDNEEEMSAENE